MRKGEVQSLRWHDVHGDAITLRAKGREFQCENRRTYLNEDSASLLLSLGVCPASLSVHFERQRSRNAPVARRGGYDDAIGAGWRSGDWWWSRD